MPRTEPQIIVYTEVYPAGFEDQKYLVPVYEGTSRKAAFDAASHELETLKSRCLPVEGNTNKWIKGDMIFNLNYVEVNS